jgi:chromosomal replication initiation ATPase DnaA
VNQQLVLDLGHRSAHGVENFLVAPCNKDAVAWLDRWPDWPAPALAVYGPGACGKTHLADIWKNRSDARMIQAGQLRESSPDQLVSGTRNVIVDDAGPGIDERGLLHLYNIVGEGGGSLLLTSRTAPARWNTGLADLRSRLAAAPAVAIGRPDDALIGAVLIKLFADRQIQLDGEVLAYVLARMERSFSAARSLVEALDRLALASHRRITKPLAREALAALEES